jgi:hypothetical protein
VRKGQVPKLAEAHAARGRLGIWLLLLRELELYRAEPELVGVPISGTSGRTAASAPTPRTTRRMLLLVRKIRWI